MIKKIDRVEEATCILVITDGKTFDNSVVTADEQRYFLEALEEQEFAFLKSPSRLIMVVKAEDQTDETVEKVRRNAAKAGDSANANNYKTITIYGEEAKLVLAAAEGVALNNYQFLPYFSDQDKRSNSLKEVCIYSQAVAEEEVEKLNILTTAVWSARDMVNMPVISFNTTEFVARVKEMMASSDASVEVLDKAQITALGMGGLLGVNLGSTVPPAMIKLEYAAKGCEEQKPLVLVGKGVLYDTGGYNLKPGNYMSGMKSDMSGAAVVANAFWSVAKAKLPTRIITLIPLTDNRIGDNALVSGDVIKMYNGKTVEVLNTDAEGRLILADALSYADTFHPALVIDAATLTGAAERAIGKYAIVGMGNADEATMQHLKKVAAATGERIAEFPFWDDYKEVLKSEIADLKNLGEINAGMITAGKFLEHFTESPYIHLDIAGVSFTDKKESYRGSGGTGVGVRTLFDFVSEWSNKR